ncbi:aa3-type cytochrome c oxidase subunit IV [Sphingomonas profundi]|nr:aa3-type cytochrome c oxidase subunit IV [Sphingomonas profundi]
MAGNNMELKAHEGTYAGFITLLKVGTGVAIAAAAVVVLLIAN